MQKYVTLFIINIKGVFSCLFLFSVKEEKLFLMLTVRMQRGLVDTSIERITVVQKGLRSKQHV